MDRSKWMRILSVLMCMALLLAGAPSGAELAAMTGDEDTVIEVPVPEADPTEVPPAPTDAPTEAPTPVPTDAQADATQAPAEAPAQPSGDAQAPEGPVEPEAPSDDLAKAVALWISAMDAEAVTDDYLRALWLYDRLIVNLVPGSADDALTALTEFSASPLGYARAYEALLHAAGFECVTVIGEDSAWNIAKLGGAWTHIDVFADDAPDSFGIHFGLTDAAMARDHRWDASSVPACTETNANYFVHERGYRSFMDRDGLSALLASAAESRTEKLFLFNAGDEPSIETAVGELLPEIKPIASAEVSEQGCFAAVLLSYNEESAPETTPDASEILTGPADARALAIVPKASKLTLGVGETASVSGWTQLPAGAQEGVQYTSANPAIASVDEDGNVLARKVGSTVITIETESKMSCTVDIEVMKAPTAVAFVVDRSVLGAGETMQLGYKLSAGATGEVTFSMPQNQNIATVTKDGLVKALNPGKVSVTVRTYNGKYKTGTLQVKPAPQNITLTNVTEETTILGLEDTFTVRCALDPGSAGKITYSSSNPAVASIDPNTGKITANSIGDGVVITASIGFAGLSKTFNLQVVDKPASVEFSQRSIMGLKEKMQLVPVLDGFKGNTCTIRYASSKPSVVAVSSTGLLLAKKTGTATITVATYNNLRATIRITVKKAPKSIALIADRTVLGVGETMQMDYKFNSGAGGGATFSIPASQQGVATVTKDGLVTAHSIGKVNITVVSYNGKRKTATLQVKAAPERIDLISAPEDIGVGATVKISAAVNDGSAGKLQYRFKNPDVAAKYASVDQNGRVKGLNPTGSEPVELIIYTYQENVECSVKLNIKPAPDTVSLQATAINLGLGEYYNLKASIPEGTAATYTYLTSNKKYVPINASTGLIKGTKVGKATVAVRTHNGKLAKMTVYVKKKPTAIKANPATLTLGVDETATLGAVLSSGSASQLTYTPTNAAIASVDQGLVKGVAVGDTTIKVSTFNGKSAYCTVHVVAAPTKVTLTLPAEIGEGQTITPTYTLEPSGSHTTPTYTVISGDAIQVKSGKLYAAKQGRATVRISTHVDGVEAEQEIIVKPVPKSISMPQDTYVLDINDFENPELRSQFQLMPKLDPSDSATTLSYVIGTAGYFTIDQDNLIHPIKRGTSKVKVVTHNNKSYIFTVQIVDRFYPESVKLAETPPSYLNSDTKQTYTPTKFTIVPADGVLDLKWTSSNPSVASVDAATGKVTALSYGRVTIKGVSQRNTKLSVSYGLVVTSSKRCLVMPAHRTDTTAINATLQQIKNVRESAYIELNELLAKGWITSSELSSRKGVVDRAFDQYLFPWMTNSKVLYWKAANSEGGQKDFKPGTVYYGMPYTQANRVNTPASAVNSGYWKKNGSYYLMQTGMFASRKYPGSDCSSFVSMAIWGTGSSRKSDTTSKIASASYYTTLSGSYAKDMRPGDILVKGGSHVVMFLYYANMDRSQIVVIEQGGGGDDPYSNCVSTSIRDISYYSSRGYKLRRANGLNMTLRS